VIKGYYDLLLTGSLAAKRKQRTFWKNRKRAASGWYARIHVPELFGAGKWKLVLQLRKTIYAIVWTKCETVVRAFQRKVYGWM